MNIYKSLVRSRLDYGVISYHSATPSALEMLVPVHHLGMRLSTGAFRTSPVESLYVESGEWSLHLQRTYSSFMYFLEVNANSEQPAYSTLNDLPSSQLFRNRPTMARTFSLRVRELAEETNLPLLEYHPIRPAMQLPPWKWQLLDCDTSFVAVTKHAPLIHIRMYFLELQHKYDCPEYYAHVSKSHARVSYAAVGPAFSDTGVLPTSTSIFTAEAYALFVAVKDIKEFNTPRVGIYADSLSVVKTLKNLKKT